jgi:hypothetical protein
MFNHFNSYANNYPYSQTYSTNPPQIQQQSQQMPTNVIWCQGEAGAKSYNLLNPGQSIWLIDSENEGVFYIKTLDASGIPLPLRIFDFKERKQKQENNPSSEYITRKEFEKRLSELKNNAKQSVQST